jgi:hypothetical protein
MPDKFIIESFRQGKSNCAIIAIIKALNKKVITEMIITFLKRSTNDY